MSHVSEGEVSETAALCADRDRLQAHIDLLEPRLRRRLAGKFRALSRGVYDLDDVMASARQRIDAAALAHRIRAHTPAQLDAYIASVAEHVACDAARHEAREHRKAGTVSPSACREMM